LSPTNWGQVFLNGEINVAASKKGVNITREEGKKKRTVNKEMFITREEGKKKRTVNKEMFITRGEGKKKRTVNKVPLRGN